VRVLACAVAFALTASNVPSGYAADGAETIGVVTALEGNVFSAGAGLAHPRRIRLHDAIALPDVIETAAASRTKILLTDDTLLTLGGESRVEFREHRRLDEADYRRTVLLLARGDVRLLVGRNFTAPGSAIEVLTPTANIVTTHASMLVRVAEPWWASREGRQTAVANIGRAGVVSFSSGGYAVDVLPNQQSSAVAREAPTSPILVRTAVGGLERIPSWTLLKDQRKTERPSELIRANGKLETTGAYRRQTGTNLQKTGATSAPPSRPRSSPAR
jgi:hypothetical protein